MGAYTYRQYTISLSSDDTQYTEIQIQEHSPLDLFSFCEEYCYECKSLILLLYYLGPAYEEYSSPQRKLSQQKMSQVWFQLL